MQDDERALESTAQYYEQHADEYFETTKHADLSHLYEQFLSNIAKNGQILDLGCGSGRDLSVFAERGFYPIGLDASARLVALANQFSSVPCFVGRFEELTFRNCFHGIWACASLLHLPHSQLAGVLLQLCKALKTKGVLFISVKEGEGEEVDIDGRYFSYYDRRALESAVQKAGLKVARTWKTQDSSGSGTCWINLLAIKDF